MALRSLLFLAVAAPAAAYEWYGVVKLSHSSEYDLTIRTLTETMRFYIAEIGATPDAAASMNGCARRCAGTVDGGSDGMAQSGPP